MPEVEAGFDFEEEVGNESDEEDVEDLSKKSDRVSEPELQQHVLLK